MIFVFGSNEAGIHGAGAAKTAVKEHGAKYGKSYGHHGNSFAIPTKDEYLEPMPLRRINQYVEGFIAYAIGHRKLRFQVTQIGCGLSGFKPEDIAPMFYEAPPIVYFDAAWYPILGDRYNYWNTTTTTE